MDENQNEAWKTAGYANLIWSKRRVAMYVSISSSVMRDLDHGNSFASFKTDYCLFIGILIGQFSGWFD